MTDLAEATEAWAGSRRLLRRLRDLLKGSGSGQQRLDQVVEIIAGDIGADVCSLYVLREGKLLELFATRGLKPEAVHQTRLRLGEGLVGLIGAEARPLALSNAQKHPNFAYRPETGEEAFNSFMGVPVLRGGETYGVLTVQHTTERHYSEEAVEALETVAMVMAEILAGADLLQPDTMASQGARLPARLPGMVLNEGLAIGTVVPQRRGIVIRRIVADDPEEELGRLATAVGEMRNAIDALLARADKATIGEHREILETYRMFAADRGWLRRIEEAIRSGLTSEAAVQKIQNETRARMEGVRDPYLRSRLSDLEDLANRLLSHLLGLDDNTLSELPADVVLVARDLGPAELLDYDLARLRAVVLEEGSPTSHVAIVAKALQVPMIGLCAGVLSQVREGDLIMVDGDNGQILLRPNPTVRASFAQSMSAHAKRREAYAAVRDLPSVTLDGHRISLMINAGLLIDLPHVAGSGAEGIGLYRTEIPFMMRDALPDVRSQTEWYQQVFRQLGDKPVFFRTLDIGGDKVLPYWRGRTDENPAIGWRAIRIGLDRPAILRLQLRALLRAGAGRRLNVIFPMISEVSEFVAAREHLDREVSRARTLGQNLPESIRAGAMLEVPALAWQLPPLFEVCDFVSVGSNDLLQFLFAADRANARLANRYDVLAPSVLNFLRTVAAAAAEADCPISLCGEMASRPLEAMALIGCGYRTLSASPQALGRVKLMINGLSVEPLMGVIADLVNSGEHSLRPALEAFAAEWEVPL